MSHLDVESTPNLKRRKSISSLTENEFYPAKYTENIYKNIYKDTTKRMHGVLYLMLRWKGSVFRLVWHELAIYTFAYFALSFVYRILMVHYPTQRQNFELFCVYCRTFDSPAPITFLTGFYVTKVVDRWWEQFMSLPWPDQLALKLVAYMPGNVSMNGVEKRSFLNFDFFLYFYLKCKFKTDEVR